MFWWVNTHNAEPLSVKLALTRGEYTSPYFITDLDGAYQIELDWAGGGFPDRQTMIDLDWKIVDESGTVIREGAYNDATGGANDILLGSYSPKLGQRQRIVVNIHQDAGGNSPNPRLEIGQPEVGLDLAEGFTPLAIEWTGAVAGVGVIVLIVMLIIWYRGRAKIDPSHLD
jgi:hypothetical protein